MIVNPSLTSVINNISALWYAWEILFYPLWKCKTWDENSNIPLHNRMGEGLHEKNKLPQQCIFVVYCSISDKERNRHYKTCTWNNLLVMINKAIKSIRAKFKNKKKTKSPFIFQYKRIHLLFITTKNHTNFHRRLKIKHIQQQQIHITTMKCRNKNLH